MENLLLPGFSLGKCDLGHMLTGSSLEPYVMEITLFLAPRDRKVRISWFDLKKILKKTPDCVMGLTLFSLGACFYWVRVVVEGLLNK